MFKKTEVTVLAAMIMFTLSGCGVLFPAGLYEKITTTSTTTTTTTIATGPITVRVKDSSTIYPRIVFYTNGGQVTNQMPLETGDWHYWIVSNSGATFYIVDSMTSSGIFDVYNDVWIQDVHNTTYTDPPIDAPTEVSALYFTAYFKKPDTWTEVWSYYGGSSYSMYSTQNNWYETQFSAAQTLQFHNEDSSIYTPDYGIDGTYWIVYSAYWAVVSNKP